MLRPLSLQDAVDIIRATFPEEELQAWSDQPEGSAGAQAHFELGVWIRNNWVYRAGSPLAVHIKEVAWFIHDDDISSVVIKALWRVLNGSVCPSIEELLGPSQRRDSGKSTF